MKNTNNFQKLANIYSELSKIVNQLQSDIEYTNINIHDQNEHLNELMENNGGVDDYNTNYCRERIEELQSTNDARNEIINKLESLKF